MQVQYSMLKEWISLYQRPPGLMPDPGNPEYSFLLDTGSRSHTLIFPEYFTLRPGVTESEEIDQTANETLKWLTKFSLEPQLKDTLIAGGSLIVNQGGKLRNATPVFFNGNLLSFYAKRNLFQNEKKFLAPGDSDLIIEHPVTGARWGFLICADVLEPSYFKNYANTDFIAVPVASPFRPEDSHEDQVSRDRSIFIEGSVQSGAMILKCCLAGFDPPQEVSPSSKIHLVQGRSLIANSTGILLAAPHIKWRGILSWSTTKGTGQLKEYI